MTLKFSPIICVLLISGGHAVIPLVSLAYIALHSPKAVSGIAFGIMEIIDGVTYLSVNQVRGHYHLQVKGYHRDNTVLCININDRRLECSMMSQGAIQAALVQYLACL